MVWEKNYKHNITLVWLSKHSVLGVYKCPCWHSRSNSWLITLRKDWCASANIWLVFLYFRPIIVKKTIIKRNTYLFKEHWTIELSKQIVLSIFFSYLIWFLKHTFKTYHTNTNDLLDNNNIYNLLPTSIASTYVYILFHMRIYTYIYIYLYIPFYTTAGRWLAAGKARRRKNARPAPWVLPSLGCHRFARWQRIKTTQLWPRGNARVVWAYIWCVIQGNLRPTIL